MNHDLELIQKWFKTWYVTFNPNKTEVVLFNGTSNNLNSNLSFNDTTLMISEC